jgi:Fe-S cluster biogenesis protein NfuA/nitrite reductase/ring-hydroxylating ferredoxin subunit
MNAHELTPTLRSDLAEFIGDIERLESIVATWDEAPRSVVAAHKLAVEALNAEAFRRLIRSLKADPAAFAAMKSAVSDELVYAVLRRYNLLKASLNERVEQALDSVRPMLRSHGGDVELIGVRPPTVEVRFKGACDGCPASALTFHAGVKKALQDVCPEITDIVQVKGFGPDAESAVRFISPFALNAKGNWIPAGTLSEFADGVVRSMQLGDRKVILWRNGASITCFENACAHLGFPIHDGEVESGIISCPHHGFRYDLATGECLTAPEVQLQPHAVRIVGAAVEVRLAA